MNYQQLAMWDESFAEFHEAVALSGRSVEDIASLGFACGAAGRTGEARAMLSELETLASLRYVPAVYAREEP